MTTVKSEDFGVGGGQIEEYSNYYLDSSKDNSTLFPSIEKEYEKATVKSNESIVAYIITVLVFIVGVTFLGLIIIGNKLVKRRQRINRNIQNIYIELTSDISSTDDLEDSISTDILLSA